MVWSRRLVWTIIAILILAQLPVAFLIFPHSESPIDETVDDSATDDDEPLGDPAIEDEYNPYTPSYTDKSLEEVKSTWEDFIQKEYKQNLEIDLENVKYYQNISEVFEPSPTQWEYISKNGFVVVDMEDKKTIEEVYKYYWDNDLPVFITTDTILHTFHLLFDQFLQDAENETLRPLLENMTSELLRQSDEIYNDVTDPNLKDGMKDVVIFFGVPAILLETGDVIPPYTENDVNEYVQKIMDAEDVEKYPGQDYTQYKPRGHYAGNPFLERYFRAMMWYGRKSFDMNKTGDVLRACLITVVNLESEDAMQAWNVIYDITAYLVGQSDSLTHFDMVRAMNVSLGSVDINLLSNAMNLFKVKKELEKDEYLRQKILSDVIYKEWWDEEPIVFPKIFQFMGQRYIPDSDVMQNVMFDRVPLYNYERRGLPSSLDVMAAIGSPRAVHNLESELEKYNYTEQLKEAWASIQLKEEDYWNQSVYFGLLRSYEELISGQEDEDYQDFMRTSAWADEKLNTALGNYAELKHDTILYGKQPYSIGIVCGTPDGMVEPYPEFYARMEDLSFKMRQLVLDYFDLDDSIGKRHAEVFEDFAFINRNLTEISIHELEGVPLTPEENQFIRTIFVQTPPGMCGWEPDGWLVMLLEKAQIAKKTKDARLVADIATDPGTLLPKPTPPKVLHVATGYFRSVIVAYEKPNGDYYFFVGPVYSFYEFPLEGFERLNDDDWRGLLDSDDRPSNPFWTSTFLVDE